MPDLTKYQCKHGVLDFCDYCWAEGFRERQKWRRWRGELKKQQQMLEEGKTKNA